MKKRTTYNTGFTLIELLLYIALSSMLLTAISLFMAVILQARIKNQVIAEVEQQGVQVMQSITQTIRNGDSVTLAPGNSASSLNIVATSGGVAIYSMASNAIRIGLIPLTNNKVVASNLNFQNLSQTSTPGIVRISFTLAYVNNIGTNEYAYTKTFTGAAALRHP